MMIRVTFLMIFFILYQPTIAQSPGYNPLNLDGSTENLSVFGKELYSLCTSSDVFQKVFSISFEVDEAAKAFYNSAVYFSGDPSNWGTLILQVSLSAAEAFSRGITHVSYFKIYTNTAEDYLSRIDAFSSNSAEELACSYYNEIEKSLRDVETTNNTVFTPPSVYEIAVASANFYGSFGKFSQKDIRHTMAFFSYQFNSVPGQYSNNACICVFDDIYEKYYDLCTQ